eukprot:CAMPEP_0180184990 /NCGR_PEP_ID=MMETSP0986-20121125/42146_1 /TAXON_ID=697907 /ORGANISM="non described non described, Strain CCMP2293" /LENGTH=132 /DNA_ID=CAMNT_0022138767 /DNA_START=337 /DNA_END=735 /DNA_ORIENTATION=-
MAVGASNDQRPDNVWLRPLNGEVDSALARVVHRLKVRARLQKQLDALETSRGHGGVQRRQFQEVAPALEVGLRLEKKLHHRCVVLVRSDVQRCAAVGIQALVDLRPDLHGPGDAFDVPGLRGFKQVIVLLVL